MPNTRYGSGKSSDRVTSDSLAEISFRRVSKYQKGQIATLALAFIFSTGACLTLSYINYLLTPDCLLFSKWVRDEKYKNSQDEIQKLLMFLFNSTDNDTSTVFPITYPTTSKTFLVDAQRGGWIFGEYSKEKAILELDGQETKWGRKRHCYVTQYGFAAAAATSFMLCWFFVFFRPNRTAYVFKKKTAASKLIIPAIIFCLAFVICVLIACFTLQLGVKEWCESVTAIFPKCSSMDKHALSWAGKTTYVDFWRVLIASQVMAWFSGVFWLASLCLLIKRLYHHVDFPDYFFSHLGNRKIIQSDTDSSSY